MSPRAPRPLSPAQRDVLTAAEGGRVYRNQFGSPYWWTASAHYTDPHRVTTQVEILMRAGLLETGPFIALGTPRLAVLTDTGRRMLEQIRAHAAPDTKAGQ